VIVFKKQVKAPKNTARKDAKKKGKDAKKDTSDI